MRYAALAVLAMLGACDRSGDRQGVGGVTADEAAQLNNAAEMLDSAANLADDTMDDNGGDALAGNNDS